MARAQISGDGAISDGRQGYSSSSASLEEELTSRFKDTMRRLFWDRLTQSLLPPPDLNASGAVGDVNHGEIREGSKVQARYRSQHGMFFAATVLSVQISPSNSDGDNQSEAVLEEESRERIVADDSGRWGGSGAVMAVDVRYDEDGVIERGIPVSRLRTANDPADFAPLLSLLGEVSNIHNSERNTRKLECRKFGSCMPWLNAQVHFFYQGLGRFVTFLDFPCVVSQYIQASTDRGISVMERILKSPEQEHCPQIACLIKRVRKPFLSAPNAVCKYLVGVLICPTGCRSVTLVLILRLYSVRMSLCSLTCVARSGKS